MRLPVVSRDRYETERQDAREQLAGLRVELRRVQDEVARLLDVIVQMKRTGHEAPPPMPAPPAPPEPLPAPIRNALGDVALYEGEGARLEAWARAELARGRSADDIAAQLGAEQEA